MVIKANCMSVNQILKSQAIDNVPSYLFCSRSESKDFIKYEINEISLNGNRYYFLSDYEIT